MKRYAGLQDWAILGLRLATAANFLSPVGSRLGVWGDGWAKFLVYAGQVNSFAPRWAVPGLAVAATVLELTLAVMLLFGWQTRRAAWGAAALTLLFALAMSVSFGVKEALDYAVFVDSASAALLATQPCFRWSVDEWLTKRGRVV